jgi:hypothetical protein
VSTGGAPTSTAALGGLSLAWLARSRARHRSFSRAHPSYILRADRTLQVSGAFRVHGRWLGACTCSLLNRLHRRHGTRWQAGRRRGVAGEAHRLQGIVVEGGAGAGEGGREAAQTGLQGLYKAREKRVTGM